MYIRRKVFSLLQDENGEERYFSTTEFEDERLYAEKDEDKKSGRGKKAAVIGSAVAAPVAVAGGYQGVRHIQKKRANKKINELNKAYENWNNLTEAEQQKVNESLAKQNKKAANGKVEEFGKKVESAPKKAVKWVKETWQGGKAKKASEQYKAELEAKGLKGAAKKTAEEKLAQYEKKAKSAGVRNKALMIATPVVATGGTIAAKKIAKNRKEKSED